MVRRKGRARGRSAGLVARWRRQCRRLAPERHAELRGAGARGLWPQRRRSARGQAGRGGDRQRRPRRVRSGAARAGGGAVGRAAADRDRRRAAAAPRQALAAIDLALQASVVAVGVDTPPASPTLGQCWVVGTAPTGSWAGEAGALAGWTAGGWRFVAPPEGMAVWDAAAGQVVRRSGGTWVSGAITGSRVVVGGVQVIGAQRPAIAAPTGGSTIDAESRAVLAAILMMLQAHGLIAA